MENRERDQIGFVTVVEVKCSNLVGKPKLSKNYALVLLSILCIVSYSNAFNQNHMQLNDDVIRMENLCSNKAKVLF